MVQIGDPMVGTAPHQLTAHELVQALRVDLAGELEAIIGYEAHINAATDPRVKQVLQHISDEEKQHVGKIQQLIALLSPNDEALTQKGRQSVATQPQPAIASSPTAPIPPIS